MPLFQTPSQDSKKDRAWLLISYFDASSKAFDYQSKTGSVKAVRVANLTREATPTRRPLRK